jgi:hypothetical protein
MNSLARYALSIGAAALFAGCSSVQLPSNMPIALGAFNGRGNAPFVRSNHQKSWMSAAARSTKYLLYVSNLFGGEIGVYDYATGTQVGTLYGAAEPAGQCVDAKGDVYITDYYLSKVIEYTHGGSSPIKTLSTSNFPDGCAVNKDGDLAVTDSSGFNGTSDGAVCVWKGGRGTPSCYQDTACAYIWPPAYDDNGNLIVVGKSSQYQSEVCGLLAGSSRMVELAFNGTIYSPSGTVWDGKYIALGDANAGDQNQTALYEVTLSGSALTEVGKTVLSDPSCGNEVDVAQPFVVGKKNTPVNRKRGKTVVGGNLACTSSGVADLWHYASGGNPYKQYNLGSGYVPYGVSVSIAK